MCRNMLWQASVSLFYMLLAEKLSERNKYSCRSVKNPPRDCSLAYKKSTVFLDFLSLSKEKGLLQQELKLFLVKADYRSETSFLFS